MSHGDSITRLPEGFQATAQTDSTPYAGLADPARNLYGIQFHPEVVHTPRGRDVLRNFVLGIAGIAPTWTAANFIDTTVAAIRERVDGHARTTGSDGLVICALSGGVDSAVAAALVHRAVGDRLTCIYVDHGLMRKKESELLRVTFERDLGMRLVMVDARERFLARLVGVEDPEQKRKIIGDEFIRVFEEEARLKGVRPDRLPDPGHALPGRHRVGHLRDEDGPEDQDPPQRGRTAGRPALPAHRTAALPVQGRGPRASASSWASPKRWSCASRFPVRVWRSGSSARSRPSASTRCARRTGSSSTRSRPRGSIASVAVVRDPHAGPVGRGDGRWADLRERRGHPGRHLEDGMTADWAKLPYDVLGKISSRIVNEVPGVNRVVYDISSKPPATIEWE